MKDFGLHKICLTLQCQTPGWYLHYCCGSLQSIWWDLSHDESAAPYQNTERVPAHNTFLQMCNGTEWISHKTWMTLFLGGFCYLSTRHIKCLTLHANSKHQMELGHRKAMMTLGPCIICVHQDTISPQFICLWTIIIHLKISDLALIGAVWPSLLPRMQFGVLAVDLVISQTPP